MIETNKIYLGSSLEVLKSFPDECIDMCVTSPPYYGLRSYGTNPQIWDGDENCKHEWIESKAELLRDNRNFQTGTQEEALADAKGTTHIKSKSELKHGFCIHCNAWKGELGLEPSFHLYLQHLWQIFDEIKRVLKKTGTCWVNLGDSYGGHRGEMKNPGYKDKKEGLGYRIESMGSKQNYNLNQMQKSLMQIPSRFSIGMTDRGWILRNSIIWYKRNCMPSSARDRFTVDYEMMYFFTKSTKYYFEQQFEPHKEASIKRMDYKWEGNRERSSTQNPQTLNIKQMCGENGRNKRCVWDITPKGYREAHFAVFPPELVETPIKAGCPEGGIVLDPFFGSGTTGEVATKLNRKFIGIELNEKYIPLAERRLEKAGKLFTN